MFNKLDMLILLLVACLIISKVFAKEDDSQPVKVAECLYEEKDGMPECPNVTSGGSIPKLMECLNTMKHDFFSFCKKPPSTELLDKVREQCIEACVLPCLPTEMMSFVGECDMAMPNFEEVLGMFCDKKKRKFGNICGSSVLRKNKDKLTGHINKKIHLVCKTCLNVYNCFKRIKKEMGIK